MIDTLIELYDPREPILNVIGAWMLKPRNVLFFYFGQIECGDAVRKLSEAFASLGVGVSIHMEPLNVSDAYALADYVDAHGDALGAYAFELSGGDDVMLFMAGLSYARHACGMYARRPGGWYFSLSEGRFLDIQHARFTVPQRVALHEGALIDHVRVKPDQLTPAFCAFADAMFALQVKAPELWWNQTKCMQDAVARMPDNGCACYVPFDILDAYGFRAACEPCFDRLVQSGALTSAEREPRGYTITFPNTLTRDCMCDFGVWLELYIYSAVAASGAFDDVAFSCSLGWRENKAVNELDVIATAGLGLLVVSCKTREPTSEDISELCLMSSRFGSVIQQGVLAAMPKSHAHLYDEAARCEDMGLRLIDVRQYSRKGLINCMRRIGETLRNKL